MDTIVIITIVISTIMAQAIVVMIVMLHYYHWRNQELLVNFSSFIRENLKLKDEIDKLEEANEALRERVATAKSFRSNEQRHAST